MSSDDSKKDLATETRYRDLGGSLQMVFYLCVALAFIMSSLTGITH